MPPRLQKIDIIQPIISCYFVGSSSTPGEDKLLKYLLDAEHQAHNLMTTPLEDSSQPMKVEIWIDLIRLITVV